MAASARHETRALLRAHLSAASSYRHLTRHCPVCHHLLRLAMTAGPRAREAGEEDVEGVGDLEDVEDESPRSA
ncbi:DUF6274 family protein [Streptomyces sp. MMG1121]|uniref:DUF6274 family protein n=1 Tax=Streptomyces sp. MMG1121 TaxID=1415544 RepID=UPI0006AEB4B8|nr:DUF6274 family protein [Streptomyces sp. MMG1121]KOV61430.1 hypothetical protein ADK64_27855 [Streptomyces sp. MMG1121]